MPAADSGPSHRNEPMRRLRRTPRRGLRFGDITCSVNGCNHPQCVIWIGTPLRQVRTHGIDPGRFPL